LGKGKKGITVLPLLRVIREERAGGGNRDFLPSSGLEKEEKKEEDISTIISLVRKRR